jgi:hypothetical protein
MVMLSACNSTATGGKEKKADSLPVTPTDRIDFSGTDSIELYHYANPANQREFYRTFIRDSGFIQQITNDIMDTTIQKAPCANDFKLYLFKNGAVYKTIYAATSDTCGYLAYVINGVTYFTHLNDTAKALLNSHVKH